MSVKEIVGLKQREEGVGIFFLNKDKQNIKNMFPEAGDSITVMKDNTTILAKIERVVDHETFEVEAVGFEPSMAELFAGCSLGDTIKIHEKEILACGKNI